MAISRHDPHWKQVIANAYLAGAEFTYSPPIKLPGEPWQLKHTWHVHWNGKGATDVSKYRCALIVLRDMGVSLEFLPDAAKTTARRGPPHSLRSEP